MLIWVSVGVLTTLLASFLVLWCYFRRRKDRSKEESSVETSEDHTVELLSPTRPEGEISIMLIHRPGCDLLDTFVRDLSFIIHSYDVIVTSPLLEMSNIDAEGGLASYIQRNIDQCTYVLILVTDYSKENEDIIQLQRPFDFTIKILSGLAFRHNKISRYIPIYIKDYEQIFNFIPPFLCASKSNGFQVPMQLRELIHHMTGDSTTNRELSLKLDFFLQKLKSQADHIENGLHKQCFSHQCLQGEIHEDSSTLWSGDSSSFTRRSVTSRKLKHFMDQYEKNNMSKIDESESDSTTCDIPGERGDWISCKQYSDNMIGQNHSSDENPIALIGHGITRDISGETGDWINCKQHTENMIGQNQSRDENSTALIGPELMYEKQFKCSSDDKLSNDIECEQYTSDVIGLDISRDEELSDLIGSETISCEGRTNKEGTSQKIQEENGSRRDSSGQSSEKQDIGKNELRNLIPFAENENLACYLSRQKVLAWNACQD
ncbi:uncharacterized protein [Clytia hemisphaerica]